MNVLFIHQNFPGQFIHLSAALAKDLSHRVVALGMNDRPVPAGVELRRYALLRESQTDTHPLLREQESHVLRAEACASAALKLKHDGFDPDIVVAHPGWGEAMFIKDVFPRAKLLIYCEYFYALEGQDVGFDPDETPLTFQQKAKLRLKNTTNLLSLQIADAALCPTEWQKSTYPAWAQDKISVIHDGIDLQRLQFRPHARLSIAGHHGGAARTLQPGDEVLSFVARNLEPVRGFHIFMRCLPELLRRRPDAQVLVVGGDEVSYGHRPPEGTCWREHLLAELGGALDLKRVHFTGKLSYANYLDLLSISRLHCYWTTPFVLSWSLLEAAASGLPVLASATQPVLEFASPLRIGTIDFFDTGAWSEALTEGLHQPQREAPKRYPQIDLAHCLAEQRKLLLSI